MMGVTSFINIEKSFFLSVFFFLFFVFCLFVCFFFFGGGGEGGVDLSFIHFPH